MKATRQGPVSVLIVDDEPITIRITMLALEAQGYEVESASHGAEALAMLRERSYDVLVTDVNMPQMSGQELCETLAKEPLDYELLIFVMTGRTGAGHRKWSNASDQIEFLEKPASLRRLVARIEERLAEGPVPVEAGP